MAYVMEARENYSADIVADFASLWVATASQMYAGLSYDRVRRKIMYCANPVPLGNQIGAPISGTIVGGAFYDDGFYPQTDFTGGSGTGGTADMTVSGGAVTIVVPNGTGAGYQVGDVLSGRPSGGFGAGFTFTLTAVGLGAQNTTGFTLWSGQNAIAPGAHYDGTIFSNHSIMEKDIGSDAVTRYNAYSSSALVPSGGGGGKPTAGHITAGGAGYFSSTFFNIPLSGGSGFGLGANITVTAGAITAVQLIGGHAYMAGDVLSVNNAYIDGTGAGFTYQLDSVNTGSDGTWRRTCASNTLTSGFTTLNIPRFVDPRTGDVWAHHEADEPNTCEIYLLRRSDNFAQIISPLLPIPGGGIHMQPMALTANYLWVLNQQNGPGLSSYLVGTPRTIQAAETTADYLLPYPWYTWPYNDWTSGTNPKEASRCCVDLSNNLYFLNWNYSVGGVTRSYTLKKFTEPSAATPYNAGTVGGGFSDITPWAAGTGPNTGLPANGTFNQWLASQVVSKTALMYLPASNNLVALTKIFCVDLNQTWNSAHQGNTHFDCTYIDLTHNTFEYHANWLTGFLDANLAPTILATAAWALIDLLEIDTDLNVQSYDFTSTGVDYTKRWFFLALSPVTGGVWNHPPVDFDPTNRTALIQVQFVPGSPPAILQTIWDTGWNTAYAAFGVTIGNPNVVTATAMNSLGSTSFYNLDSGVYDSTTSAWWWSGQTIDQFQLNPAFASRATPPVPGSVISPPFLRLQFSSAPVVPPGPPFVCLMGPALAPGSPPPPAGIEITTEGGTPITTEDGTPIITEG